MTIQERIEERKKLLERIYNLVAEIDNNSEVLEKRSDEITFMQGYVAAQGDILNAIKDLEAIQNELKL